MSAVEQTLFVTSFIAASLRIATPFMFGSLGEMLIERSGVLNLGIEGIMVLGAMSGFMATYVTGNLWLGVLVAAMAGASAGIILAFLMVTLGVSQHVSGIGMTIGLTGVSYFVYRLMFGSPATLPTVTPFQPLDLEPLPEIPIVGAFFQQHHLTYIVMALLILVWYLFKRTTIGLSIRMVGNNAAAADAAGINVFLVRYVVLTVGCALIAVGGSFLSIAQFNGFTFDIVAGRGWIALALVTMGNWMPARCLFFSIFFGAVDAGQVRLQALQSGAFRIPHQYFLLLPYLLTLIFLIVAARRANYPREMLKPYRREG